MNNSAMEDQNSSRTSKLIIETRYRFESNEVESPIKPESLVFGSFRSPRSFPCPLTDEEKKKILSDSKYQRSLQSPVLAEPSTTNHHVGHKFHEVFQLKQGRYVDLPASKIAEMMKSNNLDNAPTQSLLSVVNGILDESVEKKNSEIPHRVACLLRKVVQEIERRISTQAEHLRTQSNLFKAREEKYQSRLRVLEELASGTSEENEVILGNQLKIMRMQNEKSNNNNNDRGTIEEDESFEKLMKEKEQVDVEISSVKQELDVTKRNYELRFSGFEKEANEAKRDFEESLRKLEGLLDDSKHKIRELEENSEIKYQKWIKKENILSSFMDSQVDALRELRVFSESVKQEVEEAKMIYATELNSLGAKLKPLVDAAKNYHLLLLENRKMFNELQDLKGNIRVYCRIRPFIPGQKEKKSIVENVNENGELVTANPSKPGKEGHKLFKFNKIFGPLSTQADVFSDVQPFIRSALDGYNVCIFAYGQTGSGKTYTMTGPDSSSEENWGVNYRALNDLFRISQDRRSSIAYEIGVQMVEIYNEQVRDLLSNDDSQKNLAILTNYPPNGLAVPDATMHAVRSTGDVIDLMDVGLKNRAVGATALNERSSRSHSCITIHVRGRDLKNGTTLHGNLHLVDLAGSERVDRSEVVGDRLKEAQHINKSLSALGDVIFSLSQKSSHVPYRNSKLTQVLQSSLGGQAKTLMFVQLNPDSTSYSESLSTLKFAERVSGVELGAARTNKEGRDVKELVEQVATLRNTIAKKDEEIERLQLLKELKNVYPIRGREKGGSGSSSPMFGSPSPSRESLTETPQNSSTVKGLRGAKEKEMKNGGELDQKITRAGDHEILGFGENNNADYEDRLSDDVSDGDLSVGTESTDPSIENSGAPKSNRIERTSKVSSFAARTTEKTPSPSTMSSASKGSFKVSSSSIKRAAALNNFITSAKSTSKRWQ